MEEKEIKHSQITPLGPQANSEAENFMKPVTKAIGAAKLNFEIGKRISINFF